MDYDIVIATRNRAAALALSVPLMVRQSRPPSRLIVVDSSDDPAPSRESVERGADGSGVPVEFVAHDPGISAQRNHGMSLARAPIVFHSDDDALWFDGVGEAIMRVYERDTAGLIGAVCGAAASEPPPGVLDNAEDAYRMSVLDRLRERVATRRAAIESTLFPDPFILHGRERWNKLPAPEWLEEENCVRVEWMTGARMTFRLDAIRGYGFDEALGRYSLFEDTDASFSVMRDHLVVGARNARIYHYRMPGHRGAGRAMGAVQVLNRAYIVCKHAEPGSVARRRIKRYGRYKLLQYFTGGRTGFGHDRVIGARRAVSRLDRIIEASTDRLRDVYLEVRSECLEDDAAG